MPHTMNNQGTLKTRRGFIQTAMLGSLAAHVVSKLDLFTQALANSESEPSAKAIPQRVLGKTGVKVSMIGLGGWHIGRLPSPEQATAAVHKALDLGITFFDNAPSYQDGEAERRYGMALKGRREKIFLMTKTLERRAEGARAELEASLRRLQTDHLDLWQFHAISTAEDVQTIFGPGGAYEAALKARHQGKVRYIGITGHQNPAAHLEALKYAHLLDTIQMPINVVDPHYMSFIRQVLPLAVEKKLGVLAMKTLSGGNIVTQHVASVAEALRYVWSLPVSVLITGIDSLEMLEYNVALARSFKPVSKAEQEALLARTARLAGREVENYKR